MEDGHGMVAGGRGERGEWNGWHGNEVKVSR